MPGYGSCYDPQSAARRREQDRQRAARKQARRDRMVAAHRKAKGWPS